MKATLVWLLLVTTISAVEVVERWIPQEEFTLSVGEFLDQEAYAELLSRIATRPLKQPEVTEAHLRIDESGVVRTQLRIIKHEDGWQSLQVPKLDGDLEIEKLDHSVLIYPDTTSIALFLDDAGTYTISWRQPIPVQDGGEFHSARVVHPGAPVGICEISGHQIPLTKESGPQTIRWPAETRSSSGEYTQSISNIYIVEGDQVTIHSRQVIRSHEGNLPSELILDGLGDTSTLVAADGAGVVRWNQETGQVILTIAPQKELSLNLQVTLPLGDALPTLSSNAAGFKTLRFAIVGSSDWQISPVLSTSAILDTTSFPDTVTTHPEFIGAWLVPQQAGPIPLERHRKESRLHATTNQSTKLAEDGQALHHYQITIIPVQGDLTSFDLVLPPNQTFEDLTTASPIMTWHLDGVRLRIQCTYPQAHRLDFLVSTKNSWAEGEPITLTPIQIPQAEQMTSSLAVDWPASYEINPESGLTPNQPLPWPADKTLTLSLTPPESSLDVHCQAYVSVESHAIIIRGALALDLQGARLTKLAVPWENVSFQSPMIANHENGLLHFREALRRKALLPFVIHLPRADDLTLPGLKVPMANRQTVRWMVECEPQTMLAIDSQGWRGVPMSVSPQIGGYRPSHRLLGAYEAIDPVDALTLSLKRLDRIVARSTVIDQAVLQTVITGGVGGLWHQATFQVSHAQPENLLLALPDFCEIWSLKVNDILTKPVRHVESHLQIRLPVPGETSSTVSLVYQTPSSASVTPAPQVLGDIPTLRSTRHLLGPGKIDIKVAEASDPLALFPALFRAATSEAPAYAETILQINREMHDWKIFHGETPSGRTYVPPTFIETERKVMLSKNILVRVVNALQLESKWNLSRSDAIKRVRSSLEVSEESGTDLIRIRSKQKDPAEATKIVNAVAKAYLERRMALERARSNGALDTLQKQLKNQSDKVEETRLRMLDLGERYRIIDLAAMQNRASQTGDPVTGVGTILMSSMQDTYKAESALVQIKMQIENLSGLEGERLIQSAAMLDINDPTLQSLWPTYQKAQLDKQGLLDAGLGPNHPKLRQIDGQLEKTKKMLTAAVESVRNTLKTKMDMADQALVLSKEMEEGKKDDSMDERRKVAEYSEASKEHALQKNMLANMQAKFATEQVDLTMPKTPITIHEEASVTPNQVQGILPLEIDLPDLTPKLTQTQFGELTALSFRLESAEDQTRRAWLGIAVGALLFLGLSRRPKRHPWVWLLVLAVLLGFLTPQYLPNATTLANAILLGALITAPLNLLRRHA